MGVAIAAEQHVKITMASAKICFGMTISFPRRFGIQSQVGDLLSPQSRLAQHQTTLAAKALP
jgi:hypothetical protein